MTLNNLIGKNNASEIYYDMLFSLCTFRKPETNFNRGLIQYIFIS